MSGSRRKYRRPLHERVRPLGWIRARVRGALFAFLRKLAHTDDARALVAGAASGTRPLAVDEMLDGLCRDPAVYDDLGQARTNRGGTAPVFITARFRSGSTLLWNLFRHVEGCTSYYEPLNERRWFDPAARGDVVDRTHLGVDGYWLEYEGLAELGRYYQLSWIDRNLLMDERFWAPELKAYISLMIEHAPGCAVLQFNRVDFRLPWLRRHFPDARIVHLCRHPRDQWCSALMDVACYGKDEPVERFWPHDKFYLGPWVRDLRYTFPFLDPRHARHAYELFYYVWKLSLMFGRRYAHHWLRFEDLAERPEETLTPLLDALQLPRIEPAELARLVARPALRRWRQYAPDEWFIEHEQRCEETMAEFFGAGAGCE